MTQDLVTRARRFAIEAHKRIDQRRKYSNQPYDVHLRAVADLVTRVTDDAEMIAAAWLHDVVEDTPATFHDIESEFGNGVVQLVADLTDISRPGDGNRATRKAIDKAHLAEASPRAKTVKLADLIDNCGDICGHDHRFARVYIAEMAAMLVVLEEGDGHLMERARRTLSDCTRQLGLAVESLWTTEAGEPSAAVADGGAQVRALRLFSEAFTAKDIAEPLRSFDADAATLTARASMETADQEVAGVRRDGVVTGFVRREWLSAGTCAEVMRSFAPGQVLSADASLSDVIHVLTRNNVCFLTLLGGVEGLVTRADIQKPVARMWLFGMITMLEMDLTERVRTTWPDGSWYSLLPEGRLRKTEELMAERRRRGQSCDLVDCLQLSDKAHVLLKDPRQLAEFGFSSRSVAKQVLKELESLRNNLAHGQNIVSHDWAQIARMTRRVESEAAQMKPVR